MTKIQILSLSLDQINSLIRHLTTNHNKLTFKKTRFIIQPHFDSINSNTYHLTLHTTKDIFPVLRNIIFTDGSRPHDDIILS